MSHIVEAPLFLKAILPTEDTANARMQDKKELVSAYSLVGIDASGQLVECVTCRCWMGKSSSASVIYASIWIRTNGHWFSGRGSAGGYGYHKESAAIDEAISSAGVRLKGSPYYSQQEDNPDLNRIANIAGVGDSAIRDAFAAIGAACGLSQMIICSH